MDVKITALTEPDELFHHYPSQTNSQEAVLVLNLEDGNLTARYDPEIGGGVPSSVHHHRVLWIGIPTLTADAANALLEEVAPIAQRILDGSEIEWDGNNHVGRLDADAQAAYEELAERCARENFETSETVEGIHADDYYTNISSSEVIDQFELTADTIDAEIAEKARQEEEEARNNSEAGYTVLSGVEEYLTDLRDELREAARDELREVGEQVKKATARRDELIARVYAWGSDSDRAIGELAGVSHTAVQKKTGR